MTGFENLLLVLSISIGAVFMMRYVKLPPVLGYLLTGLIVGPNGLSLLNMGLDLNFIAEFGVVFLLFTIGLELSVPKLVAMRRALLGLGGGQVLFCTLIALLVAFVADLSASAAIAVAGAVTLSSTALVTKQLIEQDELHKEHGKVALSILLFQDLAAVPFLILVPAFSGHGSETVAISLLKAGLTGGVVFIVLVAVGRLGLRPLFHNIAALRSPELFMFTALWVVLAAAFLTEYFHLSMALGAFIAGVMLAETEYTHQVENNIESFRDLLLGLFFITIGMLIDPIVLMNDFGDILAIVAGIILCKFAIITLLGRLAGTTLKTAMRAALVLAQGGEFGFALLTLALNEQVIESHTAQVVISAIIISIGIAPILIRNNRAIAERLCGKNKTTVPDESQLPIGDAEDHRGFSDHVIICGYGRVGQTLSRFLEYEGIPYVGLDLDPVRLKEAKAAQEPVYYGDASHEHVLMNAGIEKAKMLILAFDDAKRAIRILKICRKINRKIPVLVRTTDDRQLELLQQMGATEVIPDKLESSLMLASHMLILLGMPPAKAHQQIWEVKSNRYRMLRGFFAGRDDRDTSKSAGDGSTPESLHAVVLTGQAHAIGRTIAEVQNNIPLVQIVSFTRNGFKCAHPAMDTLLSPQDVIVLQGTNEHLFLAEEKLLQG